MISRVTPARVLGATAALAMLAIAAVASAGGGACGAKSAAKTACAASTCAHTACAAPKSAASASRILTPLGGTVAAAPARAFPGLPGFASPSPVVAGLMAFIDPETGLIGGPITELNVPADIAESRNATLELTPVTMPDGSIMLDLQGSIQDYYVMQVDAFGQRSFSCVHDAGKLAPHAPAIKTTVKPAPVLLPYAER